MKEFKDKTYFVLYDIDDYPLCYFETLEELQKSINYDSSKLLYRFKNEGSLIKIIMNNKFYRLARFVD